MANKWVQFVKEYAREHNLSYMCALTDKNCRQAYLEKQNRSMSSITMSSKSRSSKSRSSKSRSSKSRSSKSRSRSMMRSRSRSRSKNNVRTDIMPLSSDIYSPISDIDYWIKK
jgi:hypothetical protein